MATIQKLLRSCLDKLTEIASSEGLSQFNNQVPKYAWTDELGRLRIWASNLGWSSIDNRHIRDQAIRLLTGLEKILLELEDLNTSGNDGRDSLDDEMKTLYEGFESDNKLEIQDIYQSLTNAISNLYELAIVIRHPAHHDRSITTEQHREGPHQQSSSAISDANAGPSREEGQHNSSQDIPRTPQDVPGIPQASENPWYSKALEFLSPLVLNNLNFSVNVSGPIGGMGFPRDAMTSTMGTRSQGMGFDPLSVVDVMKANGFDSSREGRLRYAAEHGIGGQPFSAEWGEAIRQDVLRRNRS